MVPIQYADHCIRKDRKPRCEKIGKRGHSDTYINIYLIGEMHIICDASVYHTPPMN